MLVVGWSASDASGADAGKVGEGDEVLLSGWSALSSPPLHDSSHNQDYYRCLFRLGYPKLKTATVTGGMDPMYAKFVGVELFRQKTSFVCFLMFFLGGENGNIPFLYLPTKVERVYVTFDECFRMREIQHTKKRGRKKKWICQGVKKSMLRFLEKWHSKLCRIARVRFKNLITLRSKVVVRCLEWLAASYLNFD